MKFMGYKEVPVCNDSGDINYYQLEMIWEEII